MKRHARSLIGLLKNHFGTLKPITGAEIGVWQGELSVDLLSSLHNLTLWMVDPWEKLIEGTPTMPKQFDEVVAAKQQAIKSTQYLKRVVLIESSVPAAAQVKHTRFNFVFIDACHMYESVRDDIEAWTPLVKENGIVCGHDYDGVGDRRCGWGVKRAVDEAFGDKVQVLPGNVWWVVKNGS